MNSADRSELDDLRREQLRVRNLLLQLDTRLDLLTHRLEAPEPSVPAVAIPPPLPPLPRESPPLSAVPSSHREAEPVSAASPAGPTLETAALPPGPLQPPPAPPALFPPLPASPPEPIRETAASPSAEPGAIAPAESLELRLGTYWMPRIGIVILLTGLVFLGNYAYHRIIPFLGAGGKLALLTLAGATLGGLGAWLERSRESTRNFGRVLLAGGAATIYYTVYAAHFVAGLRVIESPLAGGGLLLALTGAFVIYADRRRSEAVALPAVLLAYYTSSINAVSSFTLFSHLLLTAVAVIFLVRHRWTRLSFLSLVATYGSYAFWRVDSVFHAAPGQFGSGLVFLALYWVLFTFAVFLAAPAAMTSAARSGFLTLNNGAFFALTALHFANHRPGSFWIFALGFGGVLLCLAALAARLRAEERAMDGAYLAQGLALVTIGLAAKLTGPQLAVVLAIESTVLLTASRGRQTWLFELAAALCALGAWGLTVEALDRPIAQPLAVAGPVMVLLLLDAWWVKRLRGEQEHFSGRAAGFAVLGLGTLVPILWHLCPAPWQPAACALASVVSLGALRLRLPEIAWPGQAFLAGGLLVFVSRYLLAPPDPWWLGAPLIVIAIALMHLWQGSKNAGLAAELRPLPPLACAAVAVVAGAVWMRHLYAGNAWLVATSVAAVGVVIYGLATRGWALAVVGQLFTIFAAGSFVSALVYENASRWPAFAPVMAVGASAALAGSFASGLSFGELRLREVVRFYRVSAFVMLAAWALVFVPAEWRVAFYGACAALSILVGATTSNQERVAIGAAYAGVALGFFWTRSDSPAIWPDLAAILAIPASLRLGQWLTGPLPLLAGGRDALVGAAMASLWLWVTRFAILHGHGGQLTAAWAMLALLIFAAGLVLRERIYRLGGFAVLALAIGRLFFVDVWRFDTLPRIVSFLVLGVVLLVLSFVYNRFSEVLRRWL